MESRFDVLKDGLRIHSFVAGDRHDHHPEDKGFGASGK